MCPLSSYLYSSVPEDRQPDMRCCPPALGDCKWLPSSSWRGASLITGISFKLSRFVCTRRTGPISPSCSFVLSKNITGATPGEFPVLFCECGRGHGEEEADQQDQGGDLRKLQYIDLLQFATEISGGSSLRGSAVVLLASEIEVDPSAGWT